MRKCPICGKVFKVPATHNKTYMSELNITGMCPDCYERTFNSAVTSDWGGVLGYCYCCDRPFYQKDLDKSERCTCGTTYAVSMLKAPETKEEWLDKFTAAVDVCTRVEEVLPKLVSDVKENLCYSTVNMLQITLLCTSPFPVDEEVVGLEVVERLLMMYIDAGWD